MYCTGSASHTKEAESLGYAQEMTTTSNTKKLKKISERLSTCEKNKSTPEPTAQRYVLKVTIGPPFGVRCAGTLFKIAVNDAIMTW